MPRKRKEDPMTTRLLAWCQYPEPHGTAYADEDFADLRKLIEVLDRAQVMRAYITAQGWRTLWRLYGLDGLLDLNRKGGWFDTRDKAAAAISSGCSTRARTASGSCRGTSAARRSRRSTCSRRASSTRCSTC